MSQAMLEFTPDSLGLGGVDKGEDYRVHLGVLRVRYTLPGLSKVMARLGLSFERPRPTRLGSRPSGEVREGQGRLLGPVPGSGSASMP
ncbi:hypothetical protein [Natronoglycomyces albus]|uniref:Uncharacterized protein n=1 Tax=Natronoglycomyces albus TaxID=2811108 RepID=A0A895XXV9_9ACTN|nr:hypothetical protein [Natronoglycomyces albus]QSB06458.1 hypothetical protein JQS30_06030 [Natronoglycomyces albus]